MKLTEIGKDIISVDEKNYCEYTSNKIHIIKLDFHEPNYMKLQSVFKNYKKTNRFIIEDNIRTYNSLLKNVSKKYYVMNTLKNSLISFFKRNNKVVLNVNNLTNHDYIFINDFNVLSDILNNLEVIILDELMFEKYYELFSS
jgi:hypothetical protein